MRRHSTATLMGLTKKELVEYVRIAEHNQDVAEEALNQQAENVKDWMPVVHGRWVNAAGGRTICNNCGNYPLYDYFGRQKFSAHCPNCGAHMDLEVE